MAHFFKVSASSLGLAAAASMAASPVLAADLPRTNVQVPVDMIGDFEAEEVNADNYRGRRYRRNRVDAGDVIGGILVLGTIAAIASAASNNNKRRETRDYPRDSAPRRGSADTQGTRGIDGAVSRCVGSIERDVRVDQVDNVSRNASGWQVTGTIYNGDSFSCRIDQNGKIEDIAYGGNYSAQNSAAPAQNRQWSDDRYAAAWDRAERGETVQQNPQAVQDTRYEQASTTYGEPRYTPEQVEQRAAYPGGPLVGEAEVDAAATRIQQVPARVAQAGQ